eukprot:TRINITY_DN47923_c0_g1_i1.p1 TRINITY_DN47923_c0_g1~~TRINITY_DN47923_c0_g1_i1.p1  ORF type:complete len:610 (-),score=83.88 TRINITY_DN47923_c0_g1_i1:119-1837(-)
MAEQEVRPDHQTHLDVFVDFMSTNLINLLLRVEMPPIIRKLFVFCKKEIMEGQLATIEPFEQRGLDVEQKYCEPILRLFMNGILLPLLREPQKWSGKEVCLKRADGPMDGDLQFNIDTVLSTLAAMMGNKCEKGSRQEAIANRLYPDLLRYIVTQASDVWDDIATGAVIHTFKSHYHKTPPVVMMQPSLVMKMCNMLTRNVSKFRFYVGDALEKACQAVGEWDSDIIDEAEKRNPENLFNFHLKPRFIFIDKQVVICPASQCLVPPRWSSSTAILGENAEEVTKTVIQVMLEENPHKILEELFRDLPPLKAVNFSDLDDELKALHTAVTQGNVKNDALAAVLERARKYIEDLLNIEALPEEVLEFMGGLVVARDRHSKYLENMHQGMSLISREREAHANAMRIADIELQDMYGFTKSLFLPEKMLVAASNASRPCQLDVWREEIERRHALAGTGGGGGQTKGKTVRIRMDELRHQGKVVEVYSGLQEVPEEEIFVSIWATDTGIIMHVGFKEEDDNTIQFVKQFPITEDLMRTLRMADNKATVTIPAEGAHVIKWKSQALLELVTQVLVSSS